MLTSEMRESSREPQQLHKKGKQVCVQFGSCNGGWNCWLERRKSRRGWCGYFPSPLSHLTWHYEGGDLMIWGWQARVCPCYGLLDFSTNGRLRSKKEMMLWSGNSSFSWHSPWKGMRKRRLAPVAELQVSYLVDLIFLFHPQSGIDH